MSTLSPKICVALIDDHPLFRAGMAWALRDQPAIAVVGEADHATAALQVIARTQPAVVVIDAHLRGLTGFAVARLVRRQFPRVKVVLLVPEPTAEIDARAAQSGVARCVPKAIDPPALAAVIEEVAAAPQPARRPARITAPGDCPLTGRELEVLDAIAHGMSNPAIAEHLVLRESTVKNTINSIMRKLGVHSRTMALMVALHEGWIMIGEEAAERRGPSHGMGFASGEGEEAYYEEAYGGGSQP